jgi:hypothetical protein
VAAVLAVPTPAAADSVPPRIKLEGDPNTFRNNRTDYPRVKLFFTAYNPESANEDVDFVLWKCRMDGGPWFGCPDERTYESNYQPASPLAHGAHTFEVQATDEAGNASTAALQFVVDLTPPDTSIEGGPGTTGDTRPSFQVASDDPEAAIECSYSSYELYVGAWFPCGLDQRGRATVRLPQAVKPGSHWILVRAKDPWGRVDASPARRDFVVTGGGAAAAIRGLTFPRQRLGTVLSRWLTVDLSCAGACAPRVSVSLPRALARRLGLPVTIARGGGRRSAPGRLRVKLRFSARARRTLRRLRVLRLTVRVTGAGAPVTRSITLRR